MENSSFNRNKYVFASIPSMLLVGDSAEINRSKQISLFLSELNTYNVLLKDLVNFPLKEIDRNLALNIAYYIYDNEELINTITQKKDLPFSRLSRLTKIKVEYIEKCRDYIIAYYIVLTNPNYKGIQDYFRVKLREDEKVRSISNKKETIHKGVVIKSLKKSAYILTSMGEFIKIKTNNKINVGEVAEGKEKKTLKYYKIYISILLLLLIIIGSGIVIQYRTTQSIIVIETSSNIVMHVNKFNKLIYVYSPTEKGDKLIKSTNMLNKDIDQAILETFQYALNNQMLEINKEIPALSKKILITVNGEPLKYGILSKTSKYVYDNNIPIVINNVGNQQKLPQRFDEDEENNTKK
ncbi:anti-sigma factor domain-containing protein [Clostridium sp. C2-6-12]|uniref:anti-sigma factor domain-containing protein n=1 Tax=Clostridium sp. C2-6-12 TaxID=2698832 RepID=UPI0013716553|nr:anti-sigma factor domain-containing protein [Clostridium sp. C2-6-12]